MARITAVIVLYNSSEVIRGLLESIPAASARTRTEVVVVDNASEDRDVSRRIAEEAGARFIQLEENVGYGSGANAAVEQVGDALGDLVLVCNADLRFEPGAIDVLADYAAAHPGLGSLGPAILNEDGTLYPSARRSPSLRVGIGHALLGDIAPRNRWSQKYREELGGSDAPREADWLSGACVLVPADRFRELGGFDEGYFMYFEDVDLATAFAPRAGGTSTSPRRASCTSARTPRARCPRACSACTTTAPTATSRGAIAARGSRPSAWPCGSAWPSASG